MELVGGGGSQGADAATLNLLYDVLSVIYDCEGIKKTRYVRF